MHINRLELDQFRSYRHLELDLPAAGLRLAGRNGSGKTSLLEAVVLLSTTRSPRTNVDREIVAWESGADFGIAAYSRILARFESRTGPQQVSIGVELDESRSTTARKTYQVNGETRRALDVIGLLTCVLFSPEDVVLVAGSPSLRRREIDVLLSQTDRAYLRALSAFGKVLAQRNQLLRAFSRQRRSHRDPGAVTEISFWDEQLVAHGAVVTAYRLVASARLAILVSEHGRDLMDGRNVGFEYRPRIGLPDADAQTGVEGAIDHVSAAFQRQLESMRSEEFRRGMTLLGPHRDDFAFVIDGRDLSAFGSRGQQRLGVVAFKLACLDIVRERTGDQPVLMLDDVLSELDAEHRDRLLVDLSSCGCQVLVTSTDQGLLEQPLLADLPLVEVRDGMVRPLA